MVNHTQSCKVCKANINRFLNVCFGSVEQQYSLNIPAKLEDYRHESCFGALQVIHDKLQNYRGHHDFARAHRLPPVDYYLPTRRTIVEFDESQHFTQPRLIALAGYPKELELGFDREKWMELSRTLNRHDKNPLDRDEQRAWYDTLRDFSALVTMASDGPCLTVRLYAGDQQWCLLDAQMPEVRDSFAAQIRIFEVTRS